MVNNTTVPITFPGTWSYSTERDNEIRYPKKIKNENILLKLG